jgi:hypothetical protein
MPRASCGATSSQGRGPVRSQWRLQRGEHLQATGEGSRNSGRRDLDSRHRSPGSLGAPTNHHSPSNGRVGPAGGEGRCSQRSGAGWRGQAGYRREHGKQDRSSSVVAPAGRALTCRMRGWEEGVEGMPDLVEVAGEDDGGGRSGGRRRKLSPRRHVELGWLVVQPSCILFTTLRFRYIESIACNSYYTSYTHTLSLSSIFRLFCLQA